ncbi:MAG TPA: chemotaxis protein CheW [Gemmatimonadales bacterium]|nr:chemotaxis protein CheW [Gemmatimonadales bacterium]
MSRRAAPTGDELQFILFRVGRRELSVSITQVERILPYARPESWPGRPAFVSGGVSYAEQRVPVLDLRRRLAAEQAPEEDARIMILALEGASLALAVDQVTEVARVDTRTIVSAAQPVPGLPAEATGGSFERSGRTIPILNAARLLTEAERTALAETRT